MTPERWEELFNEAAAQGEHMDDAACWEYAARHLSRELSEARADAAAKQARIDALMLEYCPTEMTNAQLAEWAGHQKPVSVERAADIDAAIAARKP